jgi:hypothetical protein
MGEGRRGVEFLFGGRLGRLAYFACSSGCGIVVGH